jgi:predicted SAM-dependent methyltransferase
MEIFKHSSYAFEDYATGKVLDIGCGRNKVQGAIGVDSVNHPGVDFIVDLNKTLPFPNESFDVVYSNQVFEHIENIIGLIGECYRVLKPGGYLIAHVPYFRSSWAVIDPTHINYYTLSSMNYFVFGTYEFNNYRFMNEAFSEKKCYLDFNYSNSFFRWFFSKIAIRWPYRFENSILSFMYPFENLTFVLKK